MRRKHQESKFKAYDIAGHNQFQKSLSISRKSITYVETNFSFQLFLMRLFFKCLKFSSYCTVDRFNAQNESREKMTSELKQ